MTVRYGAAIRRVAASRGPTSEGTEAQTSRSGASGVR